MRHLRRALLTLLIGLTLFFNMERLDVGQENLIDISSIAYVFGIVAVLCVITLRWFWRLRARVVAAMWAALYVLLRLLVFTDRPVVGNVYTYLTLTEIVFIYILILIAHELALGMHDFEDAVRNITFAEANRRVRRRDEADEDIRLELIRSRRHHRPLSVIVVEPDTNSVETNLHRTVKEIQQAMIGQYVLTSMARVIGDQVRRMDVVVDEHQNKRFLILCPDTPRESSTILAERIRSVAGEQLGVEVRYGIASFPGDALSFSDLVQRAWARLGQSPGSTAAMAPQAPPGGEAR